MIKPEPAVLVRNAYKYYGSKKDPNKRIVLNHLDMNVDKGTIYGLLGSSGCGKTTLLTCIIGRRDLKSGSINVLNAKSKEDVAPRIGYMPQEVALVSEFSVKEAIYFFGRIYGIRDDLIRERITMLMDLLELPDENRMIKNCSGGQQRRASFAAALVHEPELLILDEPTVGLDPVLRDKIWVHLIGLATKANTTIIITTHYIEEARQANRIGLMRGGKLLAEEAPLSLMNRFNCETLEEAYLLLSIRQSKDDGGSEEPLPLESNAHQAEEVVIDSNSKSVINSNNYDSKEDFSKMHAESSDVLTEKEIPKLTFKELSYFKMKKMQALFLKNIHQFFRHPGGLGFSLVFPFLQLLAFFIAVGHDPREITLAIVNHEVPMWDDCLNNTAPSVYYNKEEYSCHFDKLSCRYIESLDSNIIIKEFYSTLDQAISAVKSGHALAAMYVPDKFTEATAERTESGRTASNDSVDNSIVSLWLDMSNHQLAYFLKQKIYKDYVKYSKKVFEECTYPPRLADIPIQFNDPLFGNRDSTFSEFMVPGVMITILFFLATTATSTIIITDKLEGVWDRTIVAGVKSEEILIVHIFIQTMVILVQTIEILIITFTINQVPFIGDIFNIAFLLFLQGIAGMCFGFMISILCDTYTLAFFVSTGSFYPMILLCGIMWPIEGMAPIVKYFSMTLPFTIPIKSMRQVIEKGFPISDFSVFDGYLVTFAWIFALLVVCYIIMRVKRK